MCPDSAPNSGVVSIGDWMHATEHLDLVSQGSYALIGVKEYADLFPNSDRDQVDHPPRNGQTSGAILAPKHHQEG